MSTATMALSNQQVQRTPGHTATIYLKEAKYEFLKNLRLRMYTASVLSFPIMFYVLFGLVLNSKEALAGTPVPAYMIATLGDIRRDGRIAVWNRVGSRLRPRPGMAAGEARQPHAAVRLLRGENNHQHDFQHHHRARTCSHSALLSATCACRSRTSPACSEPWRSVRCRSPPWAWLSDISPDRTPRPRPSTLSICRCRSAVACGCRSSSFPRSCARSRWHFLLIICRNWHWESWAQESTNRIPRTGKCSPPSP